MKKRILSAGALVVVVVTLGIVGFQQYQDWSMKNAVHERYFQYWHAYESVFSNSSTDPNILENYARGNYLRKVISGAKESRKNNNLSLGNIGHSDVHITALGDYATVQDCINFKDWRLTDLAGKPVEGQLIHSQAQLYEVPLNRIDGQWYVMQPNEIGTC
ncbi:MAG: hypothetical protein LBI63_05165 [Candidatus Ancillula sp.]|jgi:hypothetical protein|nr:hypothetical protein [Candidatus Ancillula sp.]